LSEQSNEILTNIESNSTFSPLSGFTLRVVIAKKLKNIRDQIANLNGIIKNIPNSSTNAREELYPIITEYGLNKIPGFTGNTNNILNALNQSIVELENFNPNSNKSNAGVWIDNHILYLVSKILKRNIFIYDSTINKWA
jgi:hypothetical protein